ncbi:MAG: DegT/DnrJ/EryC1/StrS family aminotransferase [Bdellovibrionales bacterium]
MDKIPFMDLDAQFKSLEGPIRVAIDGVLKSRAFIQGPEVDKFEQEFLRIHGGRYGVGCANGTTALTVALRALGVGPGDEVLVPNHTFFGTVEPVVEVGATPVLVDIDPEYRQFSLRDAAAKVTKKTKAMIPVHLYGIPEPMDVIMSFADDNGLKVIEDCAQAHLAKWGENAVGTYGHIATFSFYPGKNLGAFGDAGFILTEEENLYQWMSRYVNHGRVDKYVHEFFGTNARMDGLQAAVLNVKLQKIEEWTERRRELAKAYNEVLEPKGFRTLRVRDRATPVYHLYVIEVSNRDEVLIELDRQGIGYGIHYPVPLSRQPAFKLIGYKEGQFPVSEAVAERMISLPFFPELTAEQMARVIEVFLKVARP